MPIAPSAFRWRARSAAAAAAFCVMLVTAAGCTRGVSAADASGGRSVGAAGKGSASSGTAIRPFHIAVPDEALADLRRRIAATLWPDRETVTDRSQGVQLARVQQLVSSSLASSGRRSGPCEREPRTWRGLDGTPGVRSTEALP